MKFFILFKNDLSPKQTFSKLQNWSFSESKLNSPSSRLCVACKLALECLGCRESQEIAF